MPRENVINNRSGSKVMNDLEFHLRRYAEAFLGLIPKKYYRVKYKDHGVLIHKNSSEIAKDETILSITRVWMTPRKYNSLREFES